METQKELQCDRNSWMRNERVAKAKIKKQYLRRVKQTEILLLNLIITIVIHLHTFATVYTD